jgi:type I restriction enzyme S subunit
MRYKYALLSNYADVKGGKRLPKGKNLITTPNSHPYIRVRDLGSDKVLELTADYEYVDDDTQTTIARYTVAAGDVIISIVGTIGLVGKIGLSLNGANLTENCAKIVNLHGLNADFLYYYLTSFEGQNAIKAGTVGAVQPKLPLKNIQAIPIPVISIEEQTTIADTLSALDARIAENKKINHHLASPRSATDSSPNIRRGNKASRKVARFRLSSTFALIRAKKGSIVALKSAISSSDGITTGKALRFA